MRFLLALIPVALAILVWLAVMCAGDRLPIRSCPALRNVCHDAADDVTPYLLIAFFAACALAALVLLGAPAFGQPSAAVRNACDQDARTLCPRAYAQRRGRATAIYLCMGAVSPFSISTTCRAAWIAECGLSSTCKKGNPK